MKSAEEIALFLKETEAGCPTLEAWIGWLKGAYFSHEMQIAALRNKLAALRTLALTSVNRPLTVEEARLRDVCRICRGKPSASFLYNYGKEYAHRDCVSSVADLTDAASSEQDAIHGRQTPVQ